MFVFWKILILIWKDRAIEEEIWDMVPIIPIEEKVESTTECNTIPSNEYYTITIFKAFDILSSVLIQATYDQYQSL